MASDERRKQLRRREVPHGVRYITFSCEGRLPLLGNPVIRTLFAERLEAARQGHHFDLYAWVVMPEHVHLIVRPAAERELAPALTSLKLSVARSVLNRWKHIGAPILDTISGPDGVPRFWLKGGGFDRNVRDEEELMREVCYIHNNPVKRGLVDTASDWEWSSIHWWTGRPGASPRCTHPPTMAAWDQWKGYV